MGSVWQAEHLTLRSPVAIKLIDPAIAGNADALARFLREAQSAAALRSPHVVQILDHGVDQGVPYIAMELLDGESFADRLERTGRLTPSEVGRILVHVSRAIGRAHEAGIVHRDLKPDNIYLVRNDDEEIAKVLDFGIAKSTTHGLGAAAGGTRTGAVLGTPYYMSPEQVEGSKTLDGRTDIWAMGVIAFEALLGSRPFDEESLGSLLLAICTRPAPVPSQRGRVPAGFDHWFARACARDVSLRFGNAREAAAELRQICEGGSLAGADRADTFLSGRPSAPGELASAAPLADSRAPQRTTGNAPSNRTLTVHSLPGLAATHDGQPGAPASKSRTVLALALLGGGVVLVAGGALTWQRLAGGVQSAVNAQPSAVQPPSVPVHVEPSAALPIAPSVETAPSVVPLPAANPVSDSARVAPAGTPRPAAQRANAAGKPRTSTAHPAAIAATAAPAAAPPQPPPAPKPPAADSRVNLGI